MATYEPWLKCASQQTNSSSSVASAMSLESILAKSNESCKSISSLHFHSGSIFANSVIKNQEVTNLITDLTINLPNNSHFLKYNSSTNTLNRFDGAKFQEDPNYYTQDFNNRDVTIKVPQLPQQDEVSMGANIYYLNKIQDINNKLLVCKDHESEPLIDELIVVLKKLNESYPINVLNEYLDTLKLRNLSLNTDIAQLKKLTEEFETQLKLFNQEINNDHENQLKTASDLILEKKLQLQLLINLKKSLQEEIASN